MKIQEMTKTQAAMFLLNKAHRFDTVKSAIAFCNLHSQRFAFLTEGRELFFSETYGVWMIESNGKFTTTTNSNLV